MGGAFAEPSGAPLADYFFIAGVESSQIFERSKLSNGLNAPASPSPTPSPALGPTIEETPHEEDDALKKTPSTHNSPDPKRSSKRWSWDKRKSISSVTGLEARTPTSNRSSVTIKAPQENGGKAPVSEDDFWTRLKTFGSDRDSVAAEIHIKSGERLSQAQAPKSARPRPKTQRFNHEELQAAQKSNVGSVRRRISTMNPLTRSGTKRGLSHRMSKRVSGYNSVVPAPQRISIDPEQHPVTRPYEPVLLDQYPSKDMADELKKRPPFPDYVPMFVFPDDLYVKAADERPESSWHGFTMTTSDGSKLHGITLILWKTLDPGPAAELERQCQAWRVARMDHAEREFAEYLGQTLAADRAKLSAILPTLRDYEPDTPERERLEEQITQLEDRIAMMTPTFEKFRSGAASKIEGLTNGETGFWVPRAYGIMGRDPTMTGFWKEWLRAVSVPMLQGGVLRVPPSSPRVGTWQPLERYVVNLCAEALSPITSRTQVEMSIRELRMYARKEAVNEIPGSRSTDMFALFRALDVEVVVTLFEFALAEARIVFMSQHTSMLHLACQALVQLLYPLKWQGVYIPVLPHRLVQALDAPCPYIIGLDKKFEHVDMPEDNVWIDLDTGTIEAPEAPPVLPRQQRRKLISILRLAAAHRYTYGIKPGPPSYATDTFPHNSFTSEYPEVFDATPTPSNLALLANLPSNQFGSYPFRPKSFTPVFNAFLAARRSNSNGTDRAAPNGRSMSPGSATSSPTSANFPQPQLASSRNDSAYSLQASLREKRSGFLESARRNSSIGLDRVSTVTGRRPSMPMNGSHHGSASSVTTFHTDSNAGSSYAPSVYAQSTLAASTIMPQVFMQPRINTETTQWIEGHCMKWDPRASRMTCSICEEKAEDGIFKCTSCSTVAHSNCVEDINLVCPATFNQQQVLVAFLRCIASLFYTYRKYLTPTARGEAAKSGRLFTFNRDAFLRSLPSDQAGYMTMLSDTQAFSEFVNERDTTRPDDPSIRLFDEVILSKRNRGKASTVFGKSKVGFLEDKSDHLWRSAQAASPVSRDGPKGSATTGRMPAKLEREFMREPRMVQGMPRVMTKKPMRKQVPSMLGLESRTQSEAGPA